MSADAWGFFLGAAPGLLYVLKNMAHFQRQIMAVTAAALKEGNQFEFNFSPAMKFNYLFRPAKIIDENDGVELRKAKTVFLSGRRTIVARHCLGIALVAIGSLLGSVIATISG